METNVVEEKSEKRENPIATVWDRMEEGWKKFEEKTQPKLEELQKAVDERLKIVDEHLNGGWIKEKAQPKLEEFQKAVDERIKTVEKRLGSDWEKETARLREMADKLRQDSKNMMDRAASRLEEGYGRLLDRMGVASKDDLEALRKKLTSLQRKINGIAKSGQA